jgi:hypothetical protein
MPDMQLVVLLRRRSRASTCLVCMYRYVVASLLELLETNVTSVTALLRVCHWGSFRPTTLVIPLQGSAWHAAIQGSVSPRYVADSCPADH